MSTRITKVFFGLGRWYECHVYLDIADDRYHVCFGDEWNGREWLHVTLWKRHVTLWKRRRR